jgi:DNA-binding NtrC family response regulator
MSTHEPDPALPRPQPLPEELPLPAGVDPHTPLPDGPPLAQPPAGGSAPPPAAAAIGADAIGADGPPAASSSVGSSATASSAATPSGSAAGSAAGATAAVTPTPGAPPRRTTPVGSMSQTVLLVDDEADQCELHRAMLQREGFVVKATTSPREAVGLCDDVHVVVTDLQMDEMSGLELVERLRERRPDLPVLLLTGMGTMETAIGALRVGAYDFLTKPVDPKLLAVRVRRAADFASMSTEIKRLREEKLNVAPGKFIGSSPAMRRVQELVARVAPTDASVLIHGETGTGKELVARAIHDGGSRKDGPFVAINCAAVPATLLESELFGHVKGAFTDAKGARDGLFVQASGGTLFLDEIGEMPTDMQAKLLRALQEKTVRPVGASAEVPFDARIVCATHRDLDQLVAEGKFRQDLYYRLNVVNIELPPLRARGNDVVELAHAFLVRTAANSRREPIRLSPAVADRLLAYDWPGNVRELENCMERAVALARYDQVTVEDLPERIRAHRSDRIVVAADDPLDIITLEELERRYITRVIRLLGGNKSRAAELLGLDRRTLYRRLEKYEGERTGNGAAPPGGRNEPTGE